MTRFPGISSENEKRMAFNIFKHIFLRLLSRAARFSSWSVSCSPPLSPLFGLLLCPLHHHSSRATSSKWAPHRSIVWNGTTSRSTWLPLSEIFTPAMTLSTLPWPVQMEPHWKHTKSSCLQYPSISGISWRWVGYKKNFISNIILTHFFPPPVFFLRTDDSLQTPDHYPEGHIPCRGTSHAGVCLHGRSQRSSGAPSTPPLDGPTVPNQGPGQSREPAWRASTPSSTTSLPSSPLGFLAGGSRGLGAASSDASQRNWALGRQQRQPARTPGYRASSPAHPASLFASAAVSGREAARKLQQRCGSSWRSPQRCCGTLPFRRDQARPRYRHGRRGHPQHERSPRTRGLSPT